MAILDSEGRFNLSWKFDNNTITFEVSVMTNGWIGLGFSPNGGMTNADMVVGWIDNNNVPHISVFIFINDQIHTYGQIAH